MELWKSLDGLARHLAFEIVLGGDRMDAEDIRLALGSVSQNELHLFRERVKYHAFDFAPEEYRTDDFLNRMLDDWLRDVSVNGGTSVGEAYRKLYERCDRFKWFRLQNLDGSFEYAQCKKATRDLMWGRRAGGSIIDIRVDEFVSERPVSALEVARSRADALLDKYGMELHLDGPLEVVDISSFGISEEGALMSLRRTVNDLARSSSDRVYFITETAPGGKVTSRVLSDMTDGEINRLIGIFDTEKSFRDGLSLVVENPIVNQGAIIRLPKDTYVYFNDGSDRGLVAKSVFIAPDGVAMVSGKFMGSLYPEQNLPLSSLSDKSMQVIREATQSSLKQIEKQVLGMDNAKSAGRKAGKGKTIEI